MTAAQKSESPAATGLYAKQSTNNSEFTPDQTNLTRLRAKASEVGVQIYAFDDEDTGKTVFVVSRWNLTRQLDSLNSIEKWLDRVAGVSQ